MNKNQLASEVATSENLHLSTTVQTLDGVIRVAKEALAKGDSIIIRGFGTLMPVDVPERQGRNPQTGVPCTIPAHRTVRLRVSKELVSYLAQGKENAQ